MCQDKRNPGAPVSRLNLHSVGLATAAPFSAPVVCQLAQGLMSGESVLQLYAKRGVPG